MRTVIVRLRSRADEVDSAEKDILSLSAERPLSYGDLEAEFKDTSWKVATFLDDEYHRTRQAYGWAFERYQAGQLDILSSQPQIASGIVQYEKLLPSRAYAVTATEDQIDKLLRIDQVEGIHPNFT